MPINLTPEIVECLNRIVHNLPVSNTPFVDRLAMIYSIDFRYKYGTCVISFEPVLGNNDIYSGTYYLKTKKTEDSYITDSQAYTNYIDFFRLINNDTPDTENRHMSVLQRDGIYIDVFVDHEPLFISELVYYNGSLISKKELPSDILLKLKIYDELSKDFIYYGQDIDNTDEYPYIYYPYYNTPHIAVTPESSIDFSVVTNNSDFNKCLDVAIDVFRSIEVYSITKEPSVEIAIPQPNSLNRLPVGMLFLMENQKKLNQ